MRRIYNPQMSLFTSTSSKPIARELEQISKILDETPRLMEIVYEDLIRTARFYTGREGMTAEQVLRCAILKQYRRFIWMIPGHSGSLPVWRERSIPANQFCRRTSSHLERKRGKRFIGRFFSTHSARGSSGGGR
jgi:hypothetical protein